MNWSQYLPQWNSKAKRMKNTMGTKQMKMTQSLHRRPYLPTEVLTDPQRRIASSGALGAGYSRAICRVNACEVEKQADNGNGHCQHTGRFPLSFTQLKDHQGAPVSNWGIAILKQMTADIMSCKYIAEAQKIAALSAVLPQNANCILHIGS